MNNKKILVVEDENEIRELINIYLTVNQYVVVTASDGEEAISLFHSENPDLVILDILLPGKDGLEICKEVKKHSNSYVVFLSCKNDPDEIEKGYKVGGDVYITKPFDPSILIEKVNNLLNNEAV